MSANQPSTDIVKYADAMKEIKNRVEVIDFYLTGQGQAVFAEATLETIGLQFRKVLELIAFSSLIANKVLYSTAYADFSKHWEAPKLLKNLRKINPRFYPVSVVEVPASTPGLLNDLRDRDDDYLTESDLIEAHGRCGALMHSANPFSKPIDYEYFNANFIVWRTKIMNLLNSHKVHLVGDTGFYLIHMHEEGRNNNDVCWYRFELIGPIKSKLDAPDFGHSVT